MAWKCYPDANAGSGVDSEDERRTTSVAQHGRERAVENEGIYIYSSNLLIRRRPLYAHTPRSDGTASRYLQGLIAVHQVGTYLCAAEQMKDDPGTNGRR